MDTVTLRSKVWAMMASWELMRFERHGSSERDRFESWMEAVADELDMHTQGYAVDKTQEDYEEDLRFHAERINKREGRT